MKASYGTRHWSPPKGHVDPGESDYDAALRETEEEAGFRPSVLKVVPDFSVVLKYSVKNKPKIVTYWLAELIDPRENDVKLSREHEDYKWLLLNEAMALSGFEDLNEAFKKCHEKIMTL